MDNTSRRMGAQFVAALRILVIEDDALIAMFLADLLSAMGHEVCAIVETETDAVAAAARCRPDMMIVDANLREGSGAAAVAQILAWRFVPHFFVTGDPYQVQAFAPAAIILHKPFNLADLTRTIARSRQATAPSPGLAAE